MKCLKFLCQILNNLNLAITQKCVANKFLSIYKIFLQFLKFYYRPSHTLLLRYTMSSLCNAISTNFQLKLPLSYMYIPSANTDPSSHKETWMYYKIYEFFAWTFIPWKSTIIIYQWIMHFSQMPHTKIACLHTLKANAQN